VGKELMADALILEQLVPAINRVGSDTETRTHFVGHVTELTRKHVRISDGLSLHKPSFRSCFFPSEE
jgi:hypothetical protein